MKDQEYEKMYFLEENHFWFRGKREYFHSLVNRNKIVNGKMNILDVGCGTGGFTCTLKRYGRVVGIDISDKALLFSRKRRLSVKRGEAEKIPYKRNVFDLVCLIDVLYHRRVKSLVRAIGEISRVLRVGGYVVIIDSAFEVLRGGHDEVFGCKRRFTKEGLSKILKANSFEVIDSGYMFPGLFFVIFIKRRVLSWLDIKTSDVSQVPRLINFTMIQLIKLEVWLSRWFSYKLGSSVYVVARKKS